MTSDALTSFPRRHARTRRFTLGAPRSFEVSPDGRTVLFLRSPSAVDPVNDLWIHRAGESDAELLFDAHADGAGELSAAERARRERTREQASGIVRYVVDELFSTAYFVLGGSLHAVSLSDGASRALVAADAVFDPRPPRGSGSRVCYVSGREMRVTDGVVDALVPGTSEDDELVSWGSAEFVAAEEMDRTRGFWWAPEGDRLAAARVDVSAVEEWWISSPESPSTAPRPIRYPAAGTANANVQLWIVDPDDGPQVEVDWQQGRFEYIYSVSWRDRLICTVQTRDQRTLAVLQVDPASGTCTTLTEVVDSHWVEPGPGSPTFVDDKLALIVDDPVSRRLFVDGVAVTSPDVQVRQIVGKVDDSLVVTFTDDATSIVVAAVDDSGEIHTLSEPASWASASAGGGTIVVSQASIGSGTTHEIRWNDGTASSVPSMADEPGFPVQPTFHVVAARELNVALCLPDDHDGSPLPVLMDPYGGPHAQRVIAARNAFATSQWFAEQGFAVVVVDGRGTPGRGPVFEREVWGDLAAPVLDDQVDALLDLAAQRAELDLTRVGIRGWSFGGYLAALAVLRRPDVFHAAIAGAPVTDWRLYDTHYTERYLGDPNEHPEHYARSGLIEDANLLDRPLMLIHGLADDNVVSAHTLTFSRALLEAGRPHEVLPLSGVSHMTPQEQVAENLLHLQRDFLVEHLVDRPVEPRQAAQ